MVLENVDAAFSLEETAMLPSYLVINGTDVLVKLFLVHFVRDKNDLVLLGVLYLVVGSLCTFNLNYC